MPGLPADSAATMTSVRPLGERPSGHHDGPLAPFVLLDDSLSPGGHCYLFEEPVEILRCDAPEDAPATLDAVAQAGQRGLHAAGFLAYELGYLLEPRLAGSIPPTRSQPLIWMGLFERRQTLDAIAARRLIEERSSGAYRLENLRHSMARDDYLAKLARVKDYITAGDVYQINLTFKLLFDFTGDPLSLYGELRRKQRVAHGAFIHGPDFDLLSLSPELFLSVANGEALAKPMKGTAARGRTPAEDEAARLNLRGDAKQRAENLMIVDLLRNDLGRVAQIGTVAAPELFTVETYPTVHQMTSSVTARLRPGVGTLELIHSLFPCGSITGAPKVRAMEIIRELEPAPRGVYTGAIGMIAPDGAFNFNVAIRTLMLDRRGPGEMGPGEMGVGSGIVYDSVPAAEFEECLLKAQFLTAPSPPFQLIETMRWTRGEGIYLLEAHMARLAASAGYFGFRLDLPALRAQLDAEAENFQEPVQRLRLLLDEEGNTSLTATAITLPAPGALLRYVIAEPRIGQDDPFFYHKTTRREIFDGEFTRLRAATGCDEVLFLNERGELTEGSRSNLFIQRDGKLLTPPISCGLLNGTLRQMLLDDPATDITESVLRPDDLATAEAVFLGNSVRGLQRAEPLGLP